MGVVLRPFGGDSFWRNIGRYADIIQISAENPQRTYASRLIGLCLVAAFPAPGITDIFGDPFFGKSNADEKPINFRKSSGLSGVIKPDRLFYFNKIRELLLKNATLFIPEALRRKNAFRKHLKVRFQIDSRDVGVGMAQDF